MNLKELKKMIAEEYNAFSKSRRKNFKKKFTNQIRLKEQAGGPTPPPPPGMPGGPGALPKVNVSDIDVDVEGGGDAEATLKKIMDMLTDYFDGDAGAPMGDDDEKPETPPAEDEDDDKDEEDEDDKEEVNEGGCFDNSGKHLAESECYDKKGNLKEGYTNTEKSVRLQERFKKLANIIK